MKNTYYRDQYLKAVSSQNATPQTMERKLYDYDGDCIRLSDLEQMQITLDLEIQSLEVLRSAALYEAAVEKLQIERLEAKKAIARKLRIKITKKIVETFLKK